MTKTNSGRFFEDFALGETLVHPTPRTITEGDASLYVALTGDRAAVHASAEFARSLGFERERIHDLLVFHIVFGKTVGDVSLNAVANLGYAELRFGATVYPGDTLRAVSEVIGRRQNSSGKSGIVWVRTRGENQRGERVLEYERWVMVNKRDAGAPAGETRVPELAAEVAPSALQLPPTLDLSRWEAWPSGGRAMFEDYEVGERIDHVDGMTVEESDHMLATRLYQNTAKVHFDAHAMSQSRFGRRLMYGGHVISVCHALSFNGFERALGLLAINGGQHVAPTFAGDTLYAFSEVLDAQPIPGRDDVGALRVRLVGYKNTSERVERLLTRDGKTAHDPAVVLDLDRWIAMPTRRCGAG